MYKTYKCPTCGSSENVIRHTKRKVSIVFKCKYCDKFFSIKVVQKPYKSKDLLRDHLDGFSFSVLADKYNISKTTAYRKVLEELEKLPRNNDVTKKYCNKFSDIFMPDGKYICVKGYERKIPFLWGVDYVKHDFPIIYFAPSENFVSWQRYFRLLREIHSPKLIVCDDNFSLKTAALQQFPAVQIQTCYNHLKESIRRDLRVRKDTTYKPFMKLIVQTLKEKRSEADFDQRMFYIFKQYRNDPVAMSIITGMVKNKAELLAFRGYLRAPTTTNLIECFNSHLESRLFRIKGFESVEHASLWLNAYVLKRRQTKFRECTGYFRRLNGKRPLDMTAKDGVVAKGFF